MLIRLIKGLFLGALVGAAASACVALLSWHFQINAYSLAGVTTCTILGSMGSGLAVAWLGEESVVQRAFLLLKELTTRLGDEHVYPVVLFLLWLVAFFTCAALPHLSEGARVFLCITTVILAAIFLYHKPQIRPTEIPIGLSLGKREYGKIVPIAIRHLGAFAYNLSSYGHREPTRRRVTWQERATLFPDMPDLQASCGEEYELYRVGPKLLPEAIADRLELDTKVVNALIKFSKAV